MKVEVEDLSCTSKSVSLRVETFRSECNETGISCINILYISTVKWYLYKLWTVRILALMKSGLDASSL